MSKRMRVKLTTFEPWLGTSPADKEIYRKYIASRSPEAKTIEEEVEAVGVDEVVEKGMTVFPRTADGKPFIYDYQIKGMFKDSCGMLQRVTGKDEETGKKKKATNESSKLTAYKKIIDGLIFPQPRRIVINFDGEMSICERPLRAQTAQGERIALSISEQIPEGATIEFDILLLNGDYEKVIREWLDYGELRGLGQWRNSGMGRFKYEVLSVTES